MANINTSRKSGFIQRSGVMRRESLWIGDVLTRTTIAAASTAVFLTTFGATILGFRPFTLIRTRGFLSLKSDQIAASESQQVAYGAAIVSDQAAAVGVTAVPTPVTDSDSDLWFNYEYLSSDFSFGTAVGFSNVETVRIIDSKAMRKVEDGQDLAEVVESSALSSGLVVGKFTRMLIKLH